MPVHTAEVLVPLLPRSAWALIASSQWWAYSLVLLWFSGKRAFRKSFGERDKGAGLTTF
jgi:hypothetical protein